MLVGCRTDDCGVRDQNYNKSYTYWLQYTSIWNFTEKGCTETLDIIECGYSKIWCSWWNIFHTSMSSLEFVRTWDLNTLYHNSSWKAIKASWRISSNLSSRLIKKKDFFCVSLQNVVFLSSRKYGGYTALASVRCCWWSPSHW